MSGSDMSEQVIVLATGGTGGHMFPAQALADELLARGHRPVLVTDERGAEHATFDAHVNVHVVRAGAVTGQSLLGKAKGLASTAADCWDAHRLLKEIRPSVVVGFGGFPSLPTMLAATYSGLFTVIHEQNAILGRVNRLLAPRVDSIAVSYLSTQQLSPGSFARVSAIGESGAQCHLGRERHSLHPAGRRWPTPVGDLRRKPGCCGIL